MVFNVSDDLSKLTTIPKWQIDKLHDITKLDICQCVLDSMKEENQICQIDIGIGTLFIKTIKDCVEYKFIPDAHLERMVIDTVNDKKEFLKEDLEIKSNMRILKIYKELM